MNRLRKIIAVLVALMMVSMALAGCGGAKEAERNQEAAARNSAAAGDNGAAGNGGMRIVCTAFAQYDFVGQVLGDNPAGIEVTYLLGSGVDMHSYQASAEDMIKIKTSDLLLYIGGESEQWVDTLVQQTDGNRFRALALLDMVEAKTEKIVEGMEHDHDHDNDDHEHSEDEDHTHEEDHDHADEDHTHSEDEHAQENGGQTHGAEYDEHVWLSLKNAVKIVDTISGAICEIDPANQELYQANAAAYTAKLNELDSRYVQAVSEATRDTILVADRFPFRYLADDYHLTYYAAFPGCSAETEASFETVVFLAEKIGELKLPEVLVIDGSDGKLAQTVIANSQQKDAAVKTLNSIQSVSMDDIKAGASYLGLMEANLNVLKEALN